VTWDGFVEFWGTLVREVLPAGRDVPPEVRIEEGTLAVELDAGEPVLGAAAVARVRMPDGETQVIPLTQTGESTFAGTAAATQPGPYWVAVTLERPDGSGFTSSAGAVSGYAEEYAFRQPDLATINAVAATTGGRVGVTPEQAFDEAPTRGAALLPMAGWLTAAALALFLVDVALRRLAFTTDDVADWRQGLQTERRRERRRVDQALAEAERTAAPPPMVSGSETLERLMRRKRGKPTRQ